MTAQDVAPVVRARVPFSLLAATTAVSVAFGAIFALLPDYQRAIGFADWGLGVIAGASFVAGFVAQTGLARYADRGHGRLLLIGGVATAALGCAGVAFATSLPVLIGGRVLLGLGEGAFLPAARRVVITRNPGAVGAALGRLAAAVLTGFVLGPVIGTAVASQWSERTPFTGLALVLVAMLVVVARFDVPGAGADEHDPRAIRTLLRIRNVRAALALAIGYAVAVGAYDSLWARYLRDLGASRQFVAGSMVAFALPMALLGPYGGRLADRIGPLRLGILATLVVVPFIGSYGVILAIWPVAIIAVVHSAIDMFTHVACQAEIAMSSPPQLIAAGQGLLDGTALLASAAGAIVAAPVYSHWGRGPLWIGVGIVCGLLGLVAIAIGRGGTPARVDARSEHVQHVG